MVRLEGDFDRRMGAPLGKFRPYKEHLDRRPLERQRRLAPGLIPIR